MSKEVKRYDAVHIRYEDSNIRYGEGCEVEVVTARAYDALLADNELSKQLINAASGQLQSSLAYIEKLTAERDALLAERDELLNDPKFPPKYARRLIAQLREERDRLRGALVTARDWIDFSKGAVGGGATILEEIDAALQGV